MIRVFRQLEEAACGFAPSALTIGNFDGVHAGHRTIFRRAVELGRAHGWKPSVLTFHPHPARVVAPERAPRLLSTPEQRVHWMEQAGIEQVLILPFDPEFSQLEPEEFVRRILLEKLGARAVLVGDNFRFGRRQAGTTSTLRELGAGLGLVTEVLPALRLRGRMVSSSEVRRLVEAGQVGAAGRLLGRCYELEGEVVRGRGVGSRQTVPTLNLATPAEALPAAGVYITRTRDPQHGRQWPSITNAGVRPTFDDQRPFTIETFLLAPLEGETPTRIAVEFLRRVREERRFESPESLKAQILRDVERAQAWFRRYRRWVRTSRS